jgi:hypothetical protein
MYTLVADVDAETAADPQLPEFLGQQAEVTRERGRTGCC